MHRNANFRSIARIFILAFLCSEMRSNLSQPIAAQNHVQTAVDLSNIDEVTLEKSKYHASIRLTANDDIFGEGHICDGAVIAPSVVLTAARCIYNYQSKSRRHPAEFKVVLGTFDRFQRTEYTLIYGATHAFYPNTFEATSLRDDIALILLERDIPERHPIVRAIPLLSRSNNDMRIDGATSCKPSTWAQIAKSFAANIAILSINACTKVYGKLVVRDKFCAVPMQPHQDDACSHVSFGAPLIYDNQLIGITTGTNGGGCTRKLHTAIYTDVSFHTKWIYSSMGTGTNQNSSIWGTLGFLLFTVFTLKTANIGKC